MIPILLAAVLLIQSPNGTVTGRVTSANGTPADGVRVTAKPVADVALPASPDVLISIAQTDNAGRYRLENVPPGRYYITTGVTLNPAMDAIELNETADKVALAEALIAALDIP